jgi:ribosomal protein L7/L12
LIQLPLPSHIDTTKLLELVDLINAIKEEFGVSDMPVVAAGPVAAGAAASEELTPGQHPLPELFQPPPAR